MVPAYVRLRLEIKQPGDTTKISLQLQIKERRTKTASDLVYQVLWPKERKGEGVLLHKTAGRPPKRITFHAARQAALSGLLTDE